MWEISPVQREVVDIQFANHISVLEPMSQAEGNRKGKKVVRHPSKPPAISDKEPNKP